MRTTIYTYNMCCTRGPVKTHYELQHKRIQIRVRAAAVTINDENQESNEN